jgi:hypothetical protein
MRWVVMEKEQISSIAVVTARVKAARLALSENRAKSEAREAANALPSR